MIFRTEISIEKKKFNQIDYNSKILLIGSCFSENIGKKMDYFKFQSYINPFGILFNPKVIEFFFYDVINKRVFVEKDLVFNNEKWHYLNAHSTISNFKKSEVLNKLNKTVKNTYKWLTKTSHVIITFGTAWVYKYIESGKIVANCHKIPQKNFLKTILSVDEIYSSIIIINNILKTINKNINIIYTVSPVRHIKEGIVKNNRSKVQLLSAIYKAIDCENSNKIDYFPSYEILMDDLRDYRFYSYDLIHPNSFAIDYIWNVFCNVWCNSSTKKTMQEVEKVQKSLLHKAFNLNSVEYKNFLIQTHKKKEILIKKFPFMNFYQI